MQMNASLWPQLAANSAENNAGADPWGVAAVMETQARLWNHFLDANRSFWTALNWPVPATPWVDVAS
ncbi:MAG: hypothetical protein ACJ8G7_13760, partial [Rhizobacter sp.]